jgi:hypothetical protein
MTMTLFLILLGLLIGVGRFFVPGHGLSFAGTYEAFAHIGVGVLLVLAFQREHRKTALWCLIAIIAIEIFKFAVR